MAKAPRYALSSIDLLPPEADADVSWAIQEIEEGGRLQKDIWAEFNARLADRGIGPISHSAFGRYALKKREDLRQLSEVREIANAITEVLKPEDDDSVTRLLAQLIKARVYEMVRGTAKIDPKGAKDLAQAVQAIVGAQMRSADLRGKAVAARAKVEMAVDKAGEELAKAGIDGAAVLRQIREDVYGIFDQ